MVKREFSVDEMSVGIVDNLTSEENIELLRAKRRGAKHTQGRVSWGQIAIRGNVREFKYYTCICTICKITGGNVVGVADGHHASL